LHKKWPTAELIVVPDAGHSAKGLLIVVMLLLLLLLLYRTNSITKHSWFVVLCTRAWNHLGIGGCHRQVPQEARVGQPLRATADGCLIDRSNDNKHNRHQHLLSNHSSTSSRHGSGRSSSLVDCEKLILLGNHFNININININIIINIVTSSTSSSTLSHHHQLSTRLYKSFNHGVVLRV
jgi:hypothetical protein